MTNASSSALIKSLRLANDEQSVFYSVIMMANGACSGLTTPFDCYLMTCISLDVRMVAMSVSVSTKKCNFWCKSHDPGFR